MAGAPPSEYTLGIGDGRTSSRVLKPPGGGHSNIFGAPDVELPKPRPKYNQQNSSNLNSCMNTVDPNEVVAKISDRSPVDWMPPPPSINNNNHFVSAVASAPPAPAPAAPSPPITNGAIQNGGGGGGGGAAVKKPPTPVAEKPLTPIIEKQFTPVVAAAAPASSQQSGDFQRVRQPPGGFSAGLW